VYYKFDASEELVMQPAFELLSVLSDFAEVKQGLKTLDQSETFMKYFN